MVKHSFTLLGGPSEASAAISDQLATHGHFRQADGPVDVVLVDAIDGPEPILFSDLTDADFDRLYIKPTLRLEQALRTALLRVKPGGSLILLGTDAYLGQPEGAPQSAASGTMINVARSLALQEPSLRVNMILLPYDPSRHDAATSNDAAHAATMLIASRFIRGERILVDGGSHLVSLHVARR
jgi:hypothetical protein